MIWESNLNFTLARLLKEAGLAVRAEEQLPDGTRHDIVVKLGALTAVIEAKKSEISQSRKIVASQADNRLRKGAADIAMALCYPSKTTEDNMHRKKFAWAVRNPRNLQSAPEWTEGGLDDLTAAILQLPNEIGNPDMLAEQLSESLETGASFLNANAKRAMARSLDLPTDPDKINASAMRALLVAATAMMFHARLSEHLDSAKPKLDNRCHPPEPFSGEWPPMTAGECAQSDAPAYNFAKAWNLILAVDYRPIFESAIKPLTAATSPAITRAVSRLANKVMEITAQAASLRHDLLGRIFHRILETARFDGSFYTSTAAATLLASLALREEDADWADAKSIGKLRIVDPSCGTGTLLMAAAERARDLSNRAGGAKDMEKILIEKMLYGYDTNLTATHLAATTLGLLSPGTNFARMNIERTFLGVDESGQASLGSLEFIPGGQPSLLGWAGGQQQVDADEAAAHAKKIPEFDLVIMNPPFTRDSLRHKQFSPAENASLKKREQKLFEHYISRNGNGEKVLHMSSQGNNFIVLADRLVRPGGRMAAVLPMVTATNPSSRGIRRFIANKFHVEMIIVSHDPQRPAFSENTGISELLLICRKKKSAEKCAPTLLAALDVNPDTPARAMILAAAIAANRENDPTNCLTEISAGQIANGDWLDVRFLLPYMPALFCKLRAGELFRCKQLKDFGDILTGQAVRGVFHKTSRPSSHGMTALWDHKTEIIGSMHAECDTSISFAPTNAAQAENLWKRRGRLMLPARLGLPQTRSVAVRLSRPAIGSGWCPFNFNAETDDKINREKALCLYLNASIGVLALMGIRDCRILSYPRFSKESILSLPVPDFAKLSPKKTDALAAAFDEHAKSELLPLRQMNECETRRNIDAAVADALGMSHEICNELRELLPKEPSISGRRYEPLNLKQR